MTPLDDKSSPAPDAAPVEQALDRLENIARQLEAGDLPLEDGLRLFEEGVALARQLDARLAEAEMRVETLLRGAGGAEKTIPFTPPGDEP